MVGTCKTYPGNASSSSLVDGLHVHSCCVSVERKPPGAMNGIPCRGVTGSVENGIAAKGLLMIAAEEPF